MMWRWYDSDVKVMWKRSCKSENKGKLNVGGTRPKKKLIERMFQGSDISRWPPTVCYVRWHFFRPNLREVYEHQKVVFEHQNGVCGEEKGVCEDPYPITMIVTRLSKEVNNLWYTLNSIVSIMCSNRHSHNSSDMEAKATGLGTVLGWYPNTYYVSCGLRRLCVWSGFVDSVGLDWRKGGLEREVRLRHRRKTFPFWSRETRLLGWVGGQ